jgi:hypothetical protein
MMLPGKRLRKTESEQPLASLVCPGQTGRKSRERARAKSNRKGFKGRLPFFGDEANYTQKFANVASFVRDPEGIQEWSSPN